MSAVNVFKKFMEKEMAFVKEKISEFPQRSPWLCGYFPSKISNASGANLSICCEGELVYE